MPEELKIRALSEISLHRLTLRPGDVYLLPLFLWGRGGWHGFPVLRFFFFLIIIIIFSF